MLSHTAIATFAIDQTVIEIGDGVCGSISSNALGKKYVASVYIGEGVWSTRLLMLTSFDTLAAAENWLLDELSFPPSLILLKYSR